MLLQEQFLLLLIGGNEVDLALKKVMMPASVAIRSSFSGSSSTISCCLSMCSFRGDIISALAFSEVFMTSASTCSCRAGNTSSKSSLCALLTGVKWRGSSIIFSLFCSSLLSNLRFKLIVLE